MTFKEGFDPRKFAEEHKEVLRATGTQMLDFYYDLADTLVLKIPEGTQQRIRADQAIEQLGSFAELNLQVVRPSPRMPRPLDKTKFFPGQHKGVIIQYVAETGETGFFNMYGGLRSTQVEELRDLAGSRDHHTTRTERILSQPTDLNFHVWETGQRQGAPMVDFGIQYRLHADFKLFKLRMLGDQIDTNPILTSQDRGFEEL